VEAIEVDLMQRVVGSEDGYETQGDARNGHGVEEHVDQLHIDLLHAAAQTVDQDG